MGQFADNLQPEIIQHHPIVLPALLQGMNNNYHQSQETLIAFC